jgi:3',5'-cyclic-AMP phosphodiesterase
MPQAIKIIQFTDTHLYQDSTFKMRGIDTYDSFKQTLELAVETEGTPDLVLLTGDISMDETAASYDRVKEIIKPIDAPIYFLPGNHDCYETMWNRFIEAQEQEPNNFKPDRSFTRDGWHVILLNSVVPLQVEGLLSSTELSRLDAELTEHADLNVLVCLHHNPIPITFIPEEDRGLKNPDALFQILDRHTNVRGVLWGHVHGEYFMQRNGVDLIATPSTCVQFRAIETGIIIDDRAPGYRVLSLLPGGAISTSVNRLPEVPDGLIFSETL